MNEPNPQSPILFNYSRRIWAGLAPKDVVGGKMIRIGGDFDGGYIMLDSGLDNVVAYSFGIGQEISWDLEMARRGCDVFQYDHTIAKFPRVHPKFHSFHLGVADVDKGDNIKGVSKLIAENGHTGRRDMILKCDVEGAEWGIFEMLETNLMNQFSQILVEFHGFQNLNHMGWLNKRMNVLERIRQTHEPVHVHANNWHDPIMMGGVMMPDLIEVTYVRRGDHQFETSKKIFPTAIDQPGSPFKADIFLGAIGYL